MPRNEDSVRHTPLSKITNLNLESTTNAHRTTLRRQDIIMCKRTSCSTCNKATWFGCGMHVPTVMDSIAASERCSCSPKVEREGKEYPPMGPAP
nr:hypothetical protein CFP56_19552 [Quercus suber]